MEYNKTKDALGKSNGGVPDRGNETTRVKFVCVCVCVENWCGSLHVTKGRLPGQEPSVGKFQDGSLPVGGVELHTCLMDGILPDGLEKV